MKKLLAVWALLLAAVSANAADKKCPGTVHFLDGRTLECTSITIPGWIDAEVSVRVLSDGKNQARTLAAVEIAYLELWPEKNPEAKNELYCVPFIKEKGKKKIPAARWYRNLRAGMSPSLPVIRLTKCLIKGWSGL